MDDLYFSIHHFGERGRVSDPSVALVTLMSHRNN
jgi:hypothetical protein